MQTVYLNGFLKIMEASVSHLANKEPKKGIYCLNFLKMTKFESWDFVSYLKQPTLSCLSACCQFTLCFAMYFSLCKNVWRESGMACWTATVKKGGRSLWRGNLVPPKGIPITKIVPSYYSADIPKKLVHPPLDEQWCKIFVHLRNTNYDIFDAFRELSDPP